MDPKVPVPPVRATRAKYTRAEPVAALYEQNLVHHIGMFPGLEDPLVTFVHGEASSDRLPRAAAAALVWAITALEEGKGQGRGRIPATWRAERMGDRE